MGIKVTEMTEATQVNNSDLLMIVQNGENKKITKENLQDSIVDAELEERVDTLEDEVEALQEENLYLNNLVEQAFDKKEVEGEELSINDTINAKMEINPKGNTKQETTTGKNKFDVNNNLISNSVATSGVTTTINDDGTISTSGTTNRTYINMKYQFELVAGTYIVNGCPNGGSQNGYSSLVEYTQGGTSKSAFDTGSGATFTIDTDQTITFYPIRIGSTANINMNSLIFKPMIRLSSVSDSSYEKYTGGIPSPNPSYPSNVNVVSGNNSIEICGKNLAQLENGSLWDSSGDERDLANSVRTKFITFKNGMTITPKIFTTLTTRYLQYILYDNNQTFISLNNFTDGTPITTSNTNVRYIRFKMTGPTEGTMTINDINFMVVNGSTSPTTYEPYNGNTYPINLPSGIELCKIGDYQDYFYKSNNKWYKHSEIGKVVLDGSENWYGGNSASVSTDYTYLFSNVLDNLVKSGYFKAYCNKFYNLNNTMQGTTQVSTDTIAVGDTTSYKVRIMILTSRLATQSTTGFKTWLSENNVTLYYVLATPTNTEITDTTLISQLEALKTAMSYAEQTNISQINDDIPFILKVTALASYNSRIVALENAILNANRNVPVENTRKSNEIIEEPKEEVVDDKDEVEEPKEER